MGPDGRVGRIPSHPHHPLEVAVRTEEVVGAVFEVGHRDAPVLQGHEINRHAELARAFALPADLADQRAAGIHDEDPRGLAVEHVESAGAVEHHFLHIAELLPFLTHERPDPEHLLEVGVEPAVLAGEFDGFLGVQ